jgi:hypothetical protein
LLGVLSGLQRQPGDLQKFTELAAVPRKDVKALLKPTAKCMHSVLQHAAKQSPDDSLPILHGVNGVVAHHPVLLAEVTKGPCRPLIVSIMKAASEDKGTCKDRWFVQVMCAAQDTFRIPCMEFWQKMPETYISIWDPTVAFTVVYTYGRLFQDKLVPPPSDHFSKFQHEIVALHAANWEAFEVSKVACLLSEQGLLIGEAVVPLQ